MSNLTLVILLVVVLYVLRLLLQNLRRPSRLGLVDGRLAPLDGKPNGVSSQTDRVPMQVEPWPFLDDLESTRAAVRAAIDGFGGARIVTDDPHYLHAVFSTPVMRFRDDVEFLFDEASQRVQIRSQSRAGYSDLGTNRKRVEILATLYHGR